jgi:hypothetical protein
MIDQIAADIVTVGSCPQKGTADGACTRSHQANPREIEMAKGQLRSNREIRKPKKSVAAKSAAASPGSVTSAFAKPAQGAGKMKKR